MIRRGDKNRSRERKREKETEKLAEKWCENGCGLSRDTPPDADQKSDAMAFDKIAGTGAHEELPQGSELVELLVQFAKRTLDVRFLEAARAMQQHELDGPDIVKRVVKGRDFKRRMVEFRPIDRELLITERVLNLKSAGRTGRAACEVVAVEFSVHATSFDAARVEVLRIVDRTKKCLFAMRARRLAAGPT